jgi:hypothetical protein
VLAAIWFPFYRQLSLTLQAAALYRQHRPYLGEVKVLRLTIYGDFNCPFSALASARADVLLAADAYAIDWRAIQARHGDPRRW